MGTNYCIVSMTFSQLIRGDHGRERREVTLVMNEGVELGMDLVGLSSTGVFVNKLYPGGVAHESDKLQVGDQVLEVNNQNTGWSVKGEIVSQVQEYLCLYWYMWKEHVAFFTIHFPHNYSDCVIVRGLGAMHI